jgi:hypothetical protein
MYGEAAHIGANGIPMELCTIICEYVKYDVPAIACDKAQPKWESSPCTEHKVIFVHTYLPRNWLGDINVSKNSTCVSPLFDKNGMGMPHTMHRITIDGVVCVEAPWPWPDPIDSRPTDIFIDRSGISTFVTLAVDNLMFIREFRAGKAVRAVIQHLAVPPTSIHFAGSCIQFKKTGCATICIEWPS